MFWNWIYRMYWTGGLRIVIWDNSDVWGLGASCLHMLRMRYKMKLQHACLEGLGASADWGIISLKNDSWTILTTESTTTKLSRNKQNHITTWAYCAILNSKQRYLKLQRWCTGERCIIYFPWQHFKEFLLNIQEYVIYKTNYHWTIEHLQTVMNWSSDLTGMNTLGAIAYVPWIIWRITILLKFSAISHTCRPALSLVMFFSNALFTIDLHINLLATDGRYSWGGGDYQQELELTKLRRIV